ncbi:MAG: L,D-transpeptidase family protein [Gammaproteobacteria bacterium]
MLVWLLDIRHFILLPLAIFANTVIAAEPLVLHKGSDLIGEFGKATSSYQDTLLDIARANGLGYNEIKLVNRHVDTWLPGAGQEVVLPQRYILPAAPRDGIVVNIPEMRLYFYSKNTSGETQVKTYPIGVGREGWDTPYVTTRVSAKNEKPAWYPPESIRKDHASRGHTLPRVVPPGPENPLGDYAVRLALPSYLIHGTNRPWGIGMRVSSGCIRLYPEHIESLFKQVKVGTRVEFVNQPYKIGVDNGILYLEAHPFLSEDRELFADNFNQVVKLILDRTDAGQYEVDWELIKKALDDTRGVPTPVGMDISDLLLLADSVGVTAEAGGFDLLLDDQIKPEADSSGGE